MTEAESWLFAHEAASIRVVRRGDGIIVVNKYGPGRERAVYAFEDHWRFDHFMRALQQDLANAGWSFQGVNVERRGGGDRRQASRGSDRRRDW